MTTTEEIQAACEATAVMAASLARRARNMRAAANYGLAPAARLATDAIVLADACHQLRLRYQIESRRPPRQRRRRVELGIAIANEGRS